jgi:hypothetical protein
MAQRIMIPSNVGQVSEPAEFHPDKDGKFTEQTAAAIFGQLLALTRAINGGLRFGDGTQSSKAGNMDAQTIEWTFTLADTEYEIPHSLGRTPSFVFQMPEKAAVAYVSNKGGWGPTKFYLKCNVADTTIAMVVT